MKEVGRLLIAVPLHTLTKMGNKRRSKNGGQTSPVDPVDPDPAGCWPLHKRALRKRQGARGSCRRWVEQRLCSAHTDRPGCLCTPSPGLFLAGFALMLLTKQVITGPASAVLCRSLIPPTPSRVSSCRSYVRGVSSPFKNVALVRPNLFTPAALVSKYVVKERRAGAMVRR